MKKIVFLLIAFSYFSIISAQGKFKPGIYVSQGDQRGVELKINNDNTYDLVFMSGKLDIVNDTLRLTSKYANEDKFQVKEINVKTTSNGLLLRFPSKNLYYYATEMFIGTQKDKNSIVEYKSLRSLFGNKEYDFDNEDLDVEVEKVKYIHIVLKDKDKILSSKYEVADKVSGLEIQSTINSVTNLELNAFYTDENTIAVSDGKKPLIFTLVNEEKGMHTANLKAIEIDNNAKITLPETEEDYEAVEEAVDSAAYVESDYQFKHKLDKTLNEALETLKKTPNKFLVITNDTNKEEFDSFIEENEQTLTYYMSYEYEEEYDNFNFYQATKKENKYFDKGEKKPQIVIVNSLGNVLYRTIGTLKENITLLSYYSGFSGQLKKANVSNKVDVVFQKSNKTSAELITVFNTVQSLEKKYTYEVASVVGVEDVDEESEELSYYEPETIQDLQNLYKLKTSKEVLVYNLKQLIAEFDKSKTLNSDLLMILKTELMNDGFNNRLFEEIDSNKNKELHYTITKYLVNNYSNIVEFEKTQELKEGDYNLKEAIVNYLNEATNYEMGAILKNETISLYKNFVVATNYDFNIMFGYFNVLKQVQSVDNDFYDTFDRYFNATFSKESNVIEKLDELYAKSTEEYSWITYKNTFSNFLNEVAWSIVLESNNISLIKKAIMWSEMSLKVTKNNGYYLDTLAQLYYKDNQKDKAIMTQKLALSAMEGDESTDVYQEMQEVLNKMQNGTY